MKKQIKLISQKRIDSFFGSIINYFIFLINKFKRKKIEKNPKKILFFKTEAVGDSILCLPMIKKVKEKTNAKIYVICSKANSFVFENQNFIDEIILINQKKLELVNLIKIIKRMKKEKIDFVVDTGQSSNISAILSSLIGRSSIGFKKTKGVSRNLVYSYVVNLNTKKHMVKCYFDLVKIFGIIEPKEIKLERIKTVEKENKKIPKIILNKKNLVGIHACNIFNYREWPKEKFAKIIEFLIKEKKKTVVLIGSPEEKEKNKELEELIDKKIKKRIINLAGELDFKELVSLMKHFSLFIANDGGPMHIAASENISVIGLFGYETPLRYAPFNKKSIAIYKNKECSPCHKPYCNQWTKCTHYNCIKEIEVEEVKKAIEKVFK